MDPLLPDGTGDGSLDACFSFCWPPMEPSNKAIR